MNAAKLFACALSAVSIAAPCQAGIIGYFDYVTVGMVDNATGWVCEETNPNNTPSYGVLQVWIGPVGTGHQYSTDYVLAGGIYGGYRPDVPAAGLCGSNNYTGFNLNGWFDNPANIYVYFKDNNGNYTLIGGSPKYVNGTGTFY